MEGDMAASIQKLVSASKEADCRAEIPNTFYRVNLEGECSGTTKIMEATLLWQRISSMLIGEIAAIVARKSLDGFVFEAKHLLCTGIDGNIFF